MSTAAPRRIDLEFFFEMQAAAQQQVLVKSAGTAVTTRMLWNASTSTFNLD
jgi:hypothetical protein